MRWAILFLYIACVLYVQFRGKVRHGFFRQLSDHSTFTAPFNCFAYFFSKVPTTPFVNITLFPELLPLRQQWQTIRDEALALHNASKIRSPNGHNDIGFNSFFRNGWKRFYLKWYSSSHPSAAKYCPRTVAILDNIPSVKAAMFAHLPPGGKLGLHRDPSCGALLRYHLGLATPNHNDCWISVDGERYSWRDGEAVMFDETYLHTALNGTAEDRIILFCDIERPMKYRWAAWVNHLVSHGLMRRAISPNEAGDHTGGLNRIFKYLHFLRQIGKQLRAWNKHIYYLVKWSLLGGIVFGILYAM